MPNVQVLIDEVDVTNWYDKNAGAIQISDGLNQPVAADFGVTAFDLPVAIDGGETVSIFDEQRIYFDGVIPVEAGIGTDFLYLDTLATPERYRKGIKIHAVDYQAVLDYKNLSNQTFYFQSCGAIVKNILGLSPLASLIDTTEVMDGMQLPEYSITGRKFSNVVKELAAVNGYYFSLRTVSLAPGMTPWIKTAIDNASVADANRIAGGGKMSWYQWNYYYKAITGFDAPPVANPVTTTTLDQFWTGISSKGNRRFKAEFRSLSDRPAPFTLDRDAQGYILNTLKFEPRDKPLINKVAIVGGEEASADAVVDRFQGDGVHGRFQLSRTPFNMKNSDLFKSDFGSPLDATDYTQLGAAFTGGDSTGALQINGSGALYFNTAFQSRDQRYTTFEDVTLDAGASVLCGIFSDKSVQSVANCKLGVWFKSDGTISYVKDGAEQAAPTGDPTWSPRTQGSSIYSVQIKQTSLGTMAQIQGGLISPPRHWFPLMPTGTKAQGQIWFTSTGNPLVAGSTVTIGFGSPRVQRGAQMIYIPAYTVTDADVADATLKTLHSNLTDWLNGGTDFTNDYAASFDDVNVLIAIMANRSGSDSNIPTNVDVTGTELVAHESDITGGSNGGADYGSTPEYFFTGVLSTGGTGAIRRIITRDPIGVEARLIRNNPPRTADPSPQAPARRLVQLDTVLTLGSADEVAEHYTAQIVIEGKNAYLSFFDDKESIPQMGDELVVTYRFGMPIRVVVQDETSVYCIRKLSKVPGDDGIREGTDVDVKDKIVSTDSAIRYGQQWLASRSGLSQQGSVETSSWHTLGSIPTSGQQLQIDLRPEAIQRTEVVTQVTMRHRVASHFDFTVSFGKLPDEFLLPIESANLSSRPDATTYNVRAVNEQLKFSNQITFTVL